MSSSQQKRALFIGALVLLSLTIVAPSFVKSGLPQWWPQTAIKLGLDLRGGSYLVLGVQTDEAVKSQLASMAGSIRAELKKEKVGIIRSKQFGTRSIELVLLALTEERGQENIRKLDEYIAGNYPELSNKKIKKTGNRVSVSYDLTRKRVEEIKKNAVAQAIETIRNRVDQYGVAEPVIQRTGDERIMVQLPEITDIDRVKQTIGSVARLDFRLVADADRPADETLELKVRGEPGTERLEDEVLMTGDAIETANVEINPRTNEIEVTLRLNAFGRNVFDRITRDNVGRRLAIVLDNVVQSSPEIRSRISGGNAQITGRFTREEAQQLMVVLRSGALPAPLTFEEERTVGASLGADSIRKGVNSMMIGSVLVVLFTIFYYRKSGILAVACLFMNVLFLLALLGVLKATLTLPGIAGLVLTVGMAVDANVIIFERIREEIRAGATPRAAIDAGFLKAHWTILDANITTLLTGIILYGWGTGPIKGFAVTLCLGIITSMFTALYVAKVGFSILKLRNAQGGLSI